MTCCFPLIPEFSPLQGASRLSRSWDHWSLSWCFYALGLRVVTWWRSPSSHREFLHPRFSCRSFTTYLFALNNTRCQVKGGKAPPLSVVLSNLHCILSIKGSTLIDSHQWWLQAWLPFGYHGIVMLEWALSPLFLLCSGHIYSSGRMHMYRKHRRGPFGACLCSTTNVVLLYLLSSV